MLDRGKNMVDKREVVICIIGIIATTVATVGSLSLSLVLGLVPCHLCWYQRIVMYPQPVLYISALMTTRERGLTISLGVFSFLGVLLSGYHSAIQRVGSSCSTGGCGYIQYMVGPFSIPNLAFIAFSVSLLCVFYLLAKEYQISFSW